MGIGCEKLDNGGELTGISDILCQSRVLTCDELTVYYNLPVGYIPCYFLDIVTHSSRFRYCMTIIMTLWLIHDPFFLPEFIAS